MQDTSPKPDPDSPERRQEAADEREGAPFGADPRIERLVRDLDWNLLRTFSVLASARSVSEAAERLRLSQPTVSAALKRLEERLGQRLIDRRPGHFALTEAGRTLRIEALEIEASVRRLGVALRDSSGEVRGHVRLVLASHVVTPLLDQALARFHERNPQATLSIEVVASREAVALVSARRASFAICLLRDRPPQLEAVMLYREFFGLFCGPPHPLFGKRGLTLADLAGHSSVATAADRMEGPLRQLAIMRTAAGLDERIVGTSSNLEEVRRMVMAGLGIAPFPLHVARADVERGLLWRLPPFDDPAAVDVHVVHHPQARHNRAEQALLAEILAQIEAVPLGERIYG